MWDPQRPWIWMAGHWRRPSCSWWKRRRKTSKKLGLSGCEQLSMFVFHKKQTWDWFNQQEWDRMGVSHGFTVHNLTSMFCLISKTWGSGFTNIGGGWPPELGLRQETYGGLQLQYPRKNGSYNQPTRHEGEKWSKGIWESICICSLFGCDVSYCVGIQQLFLCVDVSCVRVSGKDLVSIELYNSLPMSWGDQEKCRGFGTRLSDSACFSNLVSGYLLAATYEITTH